MARWQVISFSFKCAMALFMFDRHRFLCENKLLVISNILVPYKNKSLKNVHLEQLYIQISIQMLPFVGEYTLLLYGLIFKNLNIKPFFSAGYNGSYVNNEKSKCIGLLKKSSWFNSSLDISNKMKYDFPSAVFFQILLQ